MAETFDWGGLMNLLGTVYGIKQSQKEPNFYQVPPTPAEDWALKARQEQYANNPARNYVGEYARQYLSGLNLNPTNNVVHNSKYGDSQFMGGIKLPTFDMSRFPQIGGQQSATPPSTTPTQQTPTPGGNSGIPAPYGPSGGAGGRDPFAGFPDNSQNAQNVTWQDVKDFASQHPNGMNVLRSIASSNPFATPVAVYKMIRSWISGGSNTGEQLPTSQNQYPSDMLKPGGGYQAPDTSNYKTWEQPWNRTSGPRDAGSWIADLLGQQMGGGGGFGRKRAF